KVILSITNGNGCIDTQSHVISILDFPKASFTATSVCKGKTTSFTNASTGKGALTYSWDFGDNSKVSTLQTPTHVYASAGTFNAVLHTINANGCLDSSTSNVIVNPLP